MDLLKYLEPMKNIPERFSNLAFWRGVKKLRDEVVNAFEYVDSWGDGIELNISALRNYKISSYQSPTFDASSPSHSMILGFNDSQHWCKLTLNNVTLAKKANQIIIPMGISFNIITGDTTVGDNVSLPFAWCRTGSTSVDSITLSFINTTYVPCYSKYDAPFRGENFYIYGYIIEYDHK